MLTFAIALAALSPVQQQQVDEEDARIEVLIDQLGWADRDVRQKAVDELQRIGTKALPRLRAAAQDKDAERALLARELLWSLRKQAPGGRGGRQSPPALGHLRGLQRLGPRRPLHHGGGRQSPADRP